MESKGLEFHGYQQEGDGHRHRHAHRCGPSGSQPDTAVAGAAGHPLAQLKRTGIAQELGPNLVPNMEFAMRRARDVLREQDEQAAARRAIIVEG